MGKGAAKSRVINTLKKNKKMLLSAFNDHLQRTMDTYGGKAVVDAVDNYLESSGIEHQLTGNTVTGFTSGTFVNGTLRRVLNALDVYSGLKGPTSGYVKPGDTGFKDWGSGETIHPKVKTSPYVREYEEGKDLSFQNTHEGDSISDTERFLRSKRPSMIAGATSIVANYSPYINYIATNRNFDILETLRYNIKNDFIAAFRKTKLGNFRKISAGALRRKGGPDNISNINNIGNTLNFYQLWQA